MNKPACMRLVWVLSAVAACLFFSQGLLAQVPGTPVTFTVRTGEDGTADTPVLSIGGSFPGSPAVFNLTTNHGSGQTGIYNFTIPNATFCQITYFRLEKPGTDTWGVNEIRLSVNNLEVWFSIYNYVFSPGYWIEGSWTGTDAYISRCPATITVTTNPPGLSFIVDKVPYTSSRTFSWTIGSNHSLETVTPQGAGDSRYVFQTWSDAGALSHTITTPVGSATYTANFATQYRLAATASPPGGGSITAAPGSADGFYNSGTPVLLTAVPASGNAFSGWSGDLSGNSNPQSITMTAPRAVTALFGNCGFSIEPGMRAHGAGDETGTVSVAAANGCRWTAYSNDSWLTITSGATGTGYGTVAYAVSANTGGSRSGSLTIAGLSFVVDQASGIVPQITNLNPSRVVAGQPGFDLMVSGSNFVAGSAVLWNGQKRPTAYLGVTALRTSILASDISSAGTAQVAVANPNGATSPAKTITVQPAQNPVPAVSRLSPAGALAGGPGFILTVVGSGFVPGAKVRWGSQERAATFESSTILTAVITGAEIAQAGQVPVSVVNPLPGGGESAATAFGVWSGTVISDLSPSVVPPNSGAFKLTVFGENFLVPPPAGLNAKISHALVDGPTVLWNGQPLPTVVVSNTELQADVPAGFAAGSGAATVNVSGGGSGASNAVPLPVAVSRPTPLLSALSPKSAVPGGNRFSLVLEGRDFVDGARVLWNGQERQTIFLDSTKLQAVIPEDDIAAVGTSRVSVLNPAPGGGESNGAMFNCVATLLYPRLASIPRTSGSAYDDSEFTGIGLTNLGDKPATLTITAFDKTGELITGDGITNPALVPIEAHHQLAVINWQIFGEALVQKKPLGWFKTETSGSSLMGFFLMFNQDLSKLDGTDVSAHTSSTFVAPVIEGQGFTQLHVVNPDVKPAEVLFELYGPDGVLKAPAAGRTLPPNAEVMEYANDLFAGVTATASDYVRVVADGGVSLFEYLGKPGLDVQGLNGQDALGGSPVLYSPQYAIGPDWATRLTVVNLEDRPGTVRLRLVDDHGAQLAAPQPLAIAARGKLQIDDQKFFVDATDGRPRSGYVEVRSDGVRLAGSVVFGDPAGLRYTSALPLVSDLQTDVVFSQLVSDQTYYTGLSILNPNGQAVTAHIEVYDETGTLVAEKDEPIGSGGRVTQLLTQYFPALAGQDRSSGYIRVHANLGVASYAVFGTKPGTSLSAVPAQQVK